MFKRFRINNSAGRIQTSYHERPRGLSTPSVPGCPKEFTAVGSLERAIPLRVSLTGCPFHCGARDMGDGAGGRRGSQIPYLVRIYTKNIQL